MCDHLCCQDLNQHGHLSLIKQLDLVDYFYVNSLCLHTQWKDIRAAQYIAKLFFTEIGDAKIYLNH